MWWLSLKSQFQYPLFRIVCCCALSNALRAEPPDVSISALSDRVLLHSYRCCSGTTPGCFNIRSFGSCAAARNRRTGVSRAVAFQYPLFRIVCCCIPPLALLRVIVLVSISALSDRVLLLSLTLFKLTSPPSFNIRSFGSCAAAPDRLHQA